MSQIKDSEIHNDYWGSDHCPISVTLDIESVNLEEFKEYMALDTERQAKGPFMAISDGEEEAKSELENDLGDNDLNRKSDFEIEDNGLGLGKYQGFRDEED